MAGRVNTRFVITLSVALVLVFGGLVGAALWIRLHNAPDLARKGDVKMEEGRTLLAAGKDAEAQLAFEGAEKLYSKAVYKEQMNPFYVQKWIDSLHAWVPESQSRLFDAFKQRLQPAYRQIAVAKKNDVSAHREYLELMYRLNRMAPSRPGLEGLIADVERALQYFRGDPKENGEAQALRRYRGLVVTSMMESRAMELTPEQMDQALQDLHAAVKVDPKDSESGVAVMTWYQARARIAQTNNRPEEEIKALEAKAIEAIKTFTAEHPDDALGAMRLLTATVQADQRAIGASAATSAQAVEASRALAQKYSAEFQKVAALVSARGGEVASEELAAFQPLEGFFDNAGKLKRTREALRAKIAKHPEAPEPYLLLAQILSDADSMPESMALMQKVVDMPPLGVGLDAVQLYQLKAEALYRQALFAFTQWEGETDKQSEKAKAFLAQSRKHRVDMAQYAGSDSELLRYIDGLHSYADSDWLGAKKLLAEYIRRLPAQNIKAEWTLAQCEMRLRNWGAALDMFNRIVASRPDLDGPVVQRAALLHEMGRTDEALAALDGFLSVRTDNEAAKDMRNRIRLSRGEGEASDPVEAAILRATRLMQGSVKDPPDPEGAKTALRVALEKHSDPRLHAALASLVLEQGDQDGAKKALEAGLAAHPGDANLAKLLEGVSSEDPVAWRIKQIDETKDAPELDRLLAKHALLSAAGASVANGAQADKGVKWNAEADAALDRAAEIAPDDQRVVDRVFTRALQRKDWTGAEKMVEKAAVKDFDRVGGAMYKGRLLFSRGQVSEAAAVLREAADKGIADVASLRLLAIIYRDLGRTDDAETYFKEAIKLRPTDAQTQLLYLSLLQRDGRLSEALAWAKDAEPACRTSPEFVNLLLTLEGSVGDAKSALERREDRFKKDPRDAGNALALAQLYMDAKRWPEARTTLDGLRKIGDGVDYALADARWSLEQGDFEGTMKALNTYIERQDPKVLKPDTFFQLGRFLIDKKRFPEGIELMRRGEKFQDPKVMETDRAVAETLVDIGQPDNAIIILKHIVDAGADGEKQEVRIRLCELMAAEAARGGKVEMYKATDEQLKQVKPPTDAPVQMQVMLVRADVARGLGDLKQAEELFNRAVTQFPTEALVYFRRAQFKLTLGPAEIGKAIGDLDTAVRVRPAFWQARRLRSFVYFGMGGNENLEKAISDVKECLRINPSLDDLRLQLLQELIVRDRSSEAAELADAAAKARPNDIPLVMNLGDKFAQVEDWPRAADYYRLGWVRSGKLRADIAQMLMHALLNAPTPNLSEADEVVRDVQKLSVTDPKTGQKSDIFLSSHQLLLARAKLLMKRGRSQDAVRDIMTSMSVVSRTPPSAEQVGIWAAEVRRILPKAQDEEELLSRRDVPAAFHEWSRYLRATLAMEAADRRSQAASLLDELLATSKAPDVRRLSYRVRGTIEFMEGRYESAEATWRKGAAEFPEDWELNNNLAYVLARYMNRAKDALPFAEGAARGGRSIAEAVDTYGYVLMCNGRNPEAEVEFKKALSMTQSNRTRASVLLHLVRCFLDQNKKQEAGVQMDAVDRLMKQDPAIATDNKTEHEELKRRLGSP